MGYTEGVNDKPIYNNDITDPVGQFQASVDYAESVGNRLVGTASQRLAADRVPGLEFEETDTGNLYKVNADSTWIRVTNVQYQITGTPNGAVPASATGPVLFKVHYSTALTDRNGVVPIAWPSAFPNYCAGAWATTLVGSGQNPVVNSGKLTKASVEFVWPNNPNTNVSFMWFGVGG